MSQICYKWGTTDILWKDAGWIWSQCQTVAPPVPPVTASVSVVQPDGVDATTLTQPWIIEPWSPYRAGEQKDKRKKFIKLFFKMEGKEYSEEKEIKDLNLRVDDIKLLMSKISNNNTDLNVKLKE